MKIIVRPVVDPQREIDLTHRLVSVIDEELWNLYGGNEQLNWLEAERHLQRLIGEARDEADGTTLLSVAGAAWADGSEEPGARTDGVQEQGLRHGTGASRPRRVSRKAARRVGGHAGRRLATAGS